MQGFDVSNVLSSEAQMMKIGWFSRLPNELPTRTKSHRLAGGVGLAMLLMTGAAVGQDAPAAPAAVQNGYEIHNTADLGGHIAGITGSGAMYDTLVNIHSGPRVLGQTFTMHTVPGTKHPLFDDLTLFSGGFGGDPNNYAKMDLSKGKLYEFSGLFRRDRQYFDYDLLGSVNLPTVQIPYVQTTGVAAAAGAPSLAWTQPTDSQVMFNTVRRMTDTSLTILPLSKITFRVGYVKSIFQGPTLSPGRSIGKYDNILDEYVRNSTDDFLGAVDWKPFTHTKLTYEEQIDHYKADSYFTLDPKTFIAQEANGTPVSLGDYDAPSNPYTSAACNTGSMGSAYVPAAGTTPASYTIFSAPNTPGGLPIVNPACDVVTSYFRSQPTRILYPTEILRLQSNSIKNISLNGDFRYSVSKSNLSNYYENFNGLDGTIRSATETGIAIAQRRVVALDYGMTWQASKKISLADQVSYSNVHQPGNTTLAGSSLTTPTTTVTGNNGYETINYAGTLNPGSALSISGNTIGLIYAYFGQRYMTNHATVSWDASSRATLSLTYRYQAHTIIQTSGTGPMENLIGIDEDAGIMNIALRPTAHWDLNGSVEVSYSDNAFTPLGARQLQHYRVHTMYRPKPWATVSGAFNDLERHNNTNNTGTTSVDGPLDHVDYSRSVSLGLVLVPNEYYAFDFNYSYSDVYTSTNICYLSGAFTGTPGSTPSLPGAASTTSTGANNLCPSLLTDWGPVKDFMDAPTQYASVALAWTPVKTVHSDIGYRISAVSGNQFFNDAQEVNGSLQSAYQSPYVNLAWTVHPGLIWRAEYNFFGYGEGGPSGAPFCSLATNATTAVVPCNSSTLNGLPTGLTEPSSGLTAPRNFHANNVTLSLHYEF
jgi:hypothetical protein